MKLKKLDMNIILKNNPSRWLYLRSWSWLSKKVAQLTQCLSQRKYVIKSLQKIADNCNISVGSVKNLISNMCNKIKYVLQYKNLQLCLHLRMKLAKIHRVLPLKQSQCLKPYTNFNTKEKKVIALKKTSPSLWIKVSVLKQWKTLETE